VKLHLNCINTNETDVAKDGENLQITLKLAAYESLGKIKRRNRRKYFKIWDVQIEQLREAKNTSHKKWLPSKKLEDRIPKKRNTSQMRSEKKAQRLLEQTSYKFRKPDM
jgi:hypothetical protein